MKKRGISQETLKLIACVTMLIDHIGAALVVPDFAYYETDPQLYTTLAWINLIMRCIGRTAFPIFCFLLVEGVYHTRNPKKYALRLAISMVLSEIPFDLAFFGRISWDHQNVMVTLLLGFLMVEGMKRSGGFWKLLWIIPFYFAAEWLNTDYAGEGILLIAMFALVKGAKHEKWVRLAGMALMLWDFSWNRMWYNLEVWVPMNRLRLVSAIPIFCYDGRKLTYSKKVQWAFYLFYPVHITVLWLLQRILFN